MNSDQRRTFHHRTAHDEHKFGPRLIGPDAGDHVHALTCSQPYAFTQRFHDATVYADGAIIDRWGKVHTQGFVHNNYVEFSPYGRLGPKRTFEPPCAFVRSDPNFGHTLFEGLGRTAMLALAGYRGLPIAVAKGARLKEFLNLLDWPYIEVDIPCRFADVVMPSCPIGRDGSKNPYAWADVLWWIRMQFMPTKPLGQRRLYCTRGNAKLRNVVNEAEVIALLVGEYGFETVNLATLSVREQIDITADAELLVAPGGANSAMLGLFSRCPCIEFLPPVGGFVFGAMLYCATFGQPYHRLNGVPVGEAPTLNKQMHLDYVVSTDELRAAVCAALGWIGH